MKHVIAISLILQLLLLLMFFATVQFILFLHFANKN